MLVGGGDVDVLVPPGRLLDQPAAPRPLDHGAVHVDDLGPVADDDVDVRRQLQKLVV